jgi:hypothetical protein
LSPPSSSGDARPCVRHRRPSSALAKGCLNLRRPASSASWRSPSPRPRDGRSGP